MLDDQIGRVESLARVQGEGLCNVFQVESLRCIGGPFVVAGVVAPRAVLVKEDSHGENEAQRGPWMNGALPWLSQRGLKGCGYHHSASSVSECAGTLPNDKKAAWRFSTRLAETRSSSDLQRAPVQDRCNDVTQQGAECDVAAVDKAAQQVAQ